MSLSRNSMNGNLKVLVMAYFCLSSSALFAGNDQQIPPMKTGRELGKTPLDYAKERLSSMSRKDIEQAEYIELSKVLPSVIYQKLPWYVLKEVGFSISDDNLSRSRKYIRLAQIVKDYGQDNNYTKKWIRQQVELESLDAETINEIRYEAFKRAFENLKLLEPVVTGYDKLDYYTSLTQLELWTARALLTHDDSQLEQALAYLFECFRTRKDAEQALKDIPSGEEIVAKVESFKELVESLVVDLPDELLKEMACDENTHLSLADQGDLDAINHGIVEKYVNKAQTAINARTDLSESVKKQTIENYRALKLEKVEKYVGIKSREEKLELILAQSLLDNWDALQKIGYVSESDRSFVEQNHLLSYISLIQSYGFILGRDIDKVNAEDIETMKGRFAQKLQDLGASISMNLQIIKDSYADQ